jgi:hypothetical protein
MRALEPTRLAVLAMADLVVLDGYVDGKRRKAYFSRPFPSALRRRCSLKIWQVICVGTRVDTSFGCIDRVTKKSSNELLKSLIT